MGIHRAAGTRSAGLRTALMAALVLGGWAGALAQPRPSAAQPAPVTRAITLEAPTAGATVASPIVVRGRVTVAPFENNLRGRVYDAAGRVVGEGGISVTSDGLGGPGAFAGRLSPDPPADGPLRVEVADLDIADGSLFASATALVTSAVAAPGSWLDREQPANWNTPGAAVPPAPPLLAPRDPRCSEQERPAETPEDEQVAAAGWRLFGDYRAGWGVRVVQGLAGYDGMCRPMQYQAFVFADGVFAGTLAPTPMNSRTDGTLQSVSLAEAERLSAEFRRYAPDDPLCCPSGETIVQYELDRAGPAPDLAPLSAGTNGPSADRDQSAVTGTLSYRERIALPPGARITVTLEEASRQDAPSLALGQQAMTTTAQVPIPFEIPYDPAAIDPNGRYLIRATISADGRRLFTTTTAHPVITSGNPTTVEVVVQPA